MKIKEFALYSIFSALVVTFYLIFPPLYLLVFTVFILSLNKKNALLFGLVTGIITGIIDPKILAFSNIFWLPMIALGLKIFEVFIYGGKLNDGCLSKPRKYIGFRLGLITFILIALANIGSEIIASIIQDLGYLYIFVSMPFALLLALGSGIIIGFVGVPLQKRVSKVMYQLS
jgi:hypothetical protein